MLLVNQAVALVVALACALYLGCRRGFAARNRQYLPTVYAFVFVCVALLAANLQPHLWEELYKVLKHWALAFTGLALAWQAFSLQGFGKGERR